MAIYTGAIWTKAPISFDWWEVEITFRITGRGRIGADGMVKLASQQMLVLLHDYKYCIILL